MSRGISKSFVWEGPNWQYSDMGERKTMVIRLPYKVSVVILLVALHVADVRGYQCVSPQYLELGKRRTIECDLQESFYLLSWYDSTDYVDDQAVLYVVSSERPRGEGYVSQEYDVTPRGSLVINNVSMQHEKTFSRTSLRSSESPQKVDIVQVIVIVPSDPPFPVIKLSPDQADSDYRNRIRLLQLERSVNLECSVSDVRPRVELTWSVRTAGGSRPIPAINERTGHNDEDGGLFSTQVIITAELDKSLPLTLLTCTASAHESVVHQNQSMVLVDNVSMDLSQTTRTRKYIQLNSSLDITCTATNYNYLVWKKGAVNPQTIAYSLIDEDGYFQEVLVDGYQLSKSNSLIIPNVGVQEEGLYLCIFSDDISWNSIWYDVITVVRPSKPYPLVDQCHGKQDCSMSIRGGKGTVTCNLTGIRPEVKLNWTTFYESDSGLISFHHQSVSRIDGLTIDVSLMSQFEARDKQMTKLTIECKAYGDHSNLYPLSAKVKLLFVQDNTSTLTPTVGKTERPSSEVTVVGSVCSVVGLYVMNSFILLLVIIVLVILLKKQLKSFSLIVWSKICECWRAFSRMTWESHKSRNSDQNGSHANQHVANESTC